MEALELRTKFLMADFSFVPGLKVGSQLLLSMGKLYVKQKSTNKKTYYRCRKWGKSSGCPGSGYICAEDLRFHLFPPEIHTCLDNELTAAELKLRTKLKAKAEEAHSDLSIIYHDITANEDPNLVAKLPYSSAKQSLKRSRSKLFPSGVRDPPAVERYLESGASPASGFYQRTVKIFSNGQEEMGIILRSLDVVDKVTPATHTFLMDATFKCAPPGFYQAFTMAADVEGVTGLLFVVLMTKKVEPLYVQVLHAIREDFPQLQPKTIIGDYEAAMMSAAKAVFTEAEIAGCQYHFSDALNRKARNPGYYVCF